MKIFYIINGRIPTEKANGYQISQMCQAFGENGAKIEMLRPNRELLKEHLPFKNNLKDFYNLRTSFDVINIFSFDFIRFFNRFGSLFDRFQPIWNTLHSLSFVLGIAFYLRNKKETKNLIYMRDVNLFSWLYPFLNSALKNNVVIELHNFPQTKFRRLRYVSVLKKCRAVICITNKMRVDLVQLGLPASMTSVEHDGVDLDSFEINLTQAQCRKELEYPLDDFIIGYVGNFQTNGKEKGIDDLIRSSAIILKEFPNTNFYFVGGPLSGVPYYESVIKELNLARANFSFYDRLPVKKVPLVMGACDILTIPFPWNEHFAFYASPMKLFEYMTSDRIIVATDIESLKEVLHHNENALLAKHSDTSELAKTILIAMNDETLRARISAKALEEVKKHTWKERAGNILDFVFEKRVGQ